MVYNHGSRYLVAISEGILKTFSFARIKFVCVQKEHFVFELSLLEQIKEQNSIWLGDSTFTATLEISKDIAFYFERGDKADKALILHAHKVVHKIITFLQRELNVVKLGGVTIKDFYQLCEKDSRACSDEIDLAKIMLCKESFTAKLIKFSNGLFYTCPCQI